MTDHEATWPPRLRSTDPYIEQMSGQITALKDSIDSIETQLKRNSEATEAVLDIVTTFKTLQRVAKWVGAIAVAFTATIAALKGWGVK